jgi:putative ATPase
MKDKLCNEKYIESGVSMKLMQSYMFDGEDKLSPLADRMRPRNLDEFYGQEHIVGRGRLLRQLIETDNITSMILWGPPGVGKTTLAMIIAGMTHAEFVTFSAVTSGMKEIKEVMAKAEETRRRGIRTVLFVDEIHRFNKAQQDAFLPHVEKGNIVLIGATTENPSFEVNSALISRSRVLVLKSLELSDLKKLLKKAVEDPRGLGNIKLSIEDKIYEEIAVYANGDARCALNTLEMAALGANEKDGLRVIDQQVIQDCIQKKSLMYDKNGEEHYNIISALHKSMRNSDPDAAIYWLARMLESGEDPLYVARRIVRFASEDVGMADPRALQQAVAAFQACHFIGMPECTVNLTQAVVYLSLAPKSNSLYAGYEKAKKDAQETMAEGVPLQIRNAVTNLMGDLGYGKGYMYAHEYENKITNLQCLPDSLKDREYYSPTDQGLEKNYGDRLKYIKDIKKNMK